MLSKILLSVIILVAALVRLWGLDKVPVSLYWDEVSIGYNAYSIAETLRDEHGHFMPMLFEAFGDYKMPGYIYATAIIVKLFGLSEITTRLPSALFGIGTVIATFLFVKELFRVSDVTKIFPLTRVTAIALLSSFLLAISPWHIQFSRAGFEANGGLFFVVLGAWLFLRSLRKPILFNTMATAVTWGASLYFYRSILMFLPLLVLSLLFVYRSYVMKLIRLKTVYMALGFFVLLAVPIYTQVFFSKGSSRGNEVLITNNLHEKVSLFQMWAIQSGNGQVGNILYNKRVVYFNEITKNYLTHFSPGFLFLSGDSNPRHSTRNMGMMFLFELPLFIFGILKLYQIGGRTRNTIFFWLLLAPIPAAISLYAPHALRSLNMLPIPQIIVAIGAVFAYTSLRNTIRLPITAGVCVIAFFMVFSYMFNYLTTSSFLSASEWGDGYKQMNRYVQAHEDDYDVVVISGHYWQPYIYTLFYTQYDPAEYQKKGNQHEFGKYKFGGTSWVDGPPELGKVNLREFAGTDSALIVLSPDEYELQTQPPGILTEIKNINNKIIYFIGQVQNRNIAYE